MSSDNEGPTGLGGLHYPLTQISLVVTDLQKTMAEYHRAFGWSGWQVFDHVEPVHHGTEPRGQPVAYSLKGAEVMVGSINFELLQPLEGPSPWKEFLAEKGEAIALIAVMFETHQESEIVKAEFAKMGIDVTMRALIGDHVGYNYLDTQGQFGCLTESGNGHATDFVSPAQVYGEATTDRAAAVPAYNLTQISIVVRDLEGAAPDAVHRDSQIEQLHIGPDAIRLRFTRHARLLPCYRVTDPAVHREQLARPSSPTTGCAVPTRHGMNPRPSLSGRQPAPLHRSKSRSAPNCASSDSTRRLPGHRGVQAAPVTRIPVQHF